MGKAAIYDQILRFYRYNFKAMRLNHLVIECNYCGEWLTKQLKNYTTGLKGIVLRYLQKAWKYKPYGSITDSNIGTFE